MWAPTTQQFAVAFVVFSSVFGSVIGPIVGPFIEAHLSWQWICWTQLAFGGVAQALHLFFVPETRSAVLLDREAKRRRKAGESNIYGPSELKENRFSRHEVIKTWIRPFEMFIREPIVLCCSLLSGFSDALIFTFLEAFRPVYAQWNFTTEQMALTFVPIAIGYFIAWFSYLPPLARQRKVLRENPQAPPELRLWWLLYCECLHSHES
jgi:MFS family permease